MTDTHERAVPTLLQWAPWALVLGFFMIGGAFGSWLSATGQGGLAGFSQRVAIILGRGLPPWAIATTVTGTGLLLVIALLGLYPAWLRRRFGRCRIEEHHLTFVLPDLFAPPNGQHAPPVVQVERASATWTVTPHGVLVDAPSRSTWDRLSKPLLIPVPAEDAEALVRWLETGEGL